jgi:hypothetical protein
MTLSSGELFNVAVWTAELVLLVYIAYQSRLSNRLMAQGAQDPQ